MPTLISHHLFVATRIISHRAYVKFAYKLKTLRRCLCGTRGHGEHCSMTERRADEATREVWIVKMRIMLITVGDRIEGVIATVTALVSSWN